MSTKDVFNGATTALMMFDAYFNAVAEEIGMERALALDTKVAENLGTMQGMLIKEQSRIKKFDAKTAWPLLKSLPDGLGMCTKLVSESPQRVVIECTKCSFYEAAHMMGMDNKTIETMCRASGIKAMDTMAKQLNPNLTCRIIKFRSAPDNPCKEEFVLS